MSDNPIKYTDLFDFSDSSGIKGAIRDIKKLTEAYKDFTDKVTAGQFKMLADQQKALAESVRELANASKDLNITQKQSQQQLLDNAAAMAKLEAQSKVLNQTRRAAAQTNTAVAGSVNQLNASLRQQIAQYNALGNTEQRDIAMKRQLVQSINTTRVQIANLNGAIRQNVTQFNAAAGSYNALDAQTKKLIIDLKNLPNAFTTNSAKAKEMQAAINANVAKLKEFDKAMNITSRNVGNYASAFSEIGGSLMAMVGPIALFTAAISAIGKVIKNNAEISDSLADVRRTAELTEIEANNLLETLKKFDTRTSLKGLLDIAGIGGQLGIAKDDLVGFTRSIDRLAVVLSNEIPGGANEVATALGKINGVFETQKRENTSVEESFNKTGSAILGLGQSGLATGEFLVDFTQRVAGISKAANISLPTILAYGSVLEEAGASAEVAGTALNRLIGSLSSKREKFFAIAKMADANLTLKQFTDIINKDANQALNLFFKGLAAGNPTLTAFNDRLDTIGIKAGPSKNAILTLAQGQEKLSEKIKLSTKDYEDAEKIADQIAIKNDTLAGSMDRLGKVFENATTSGAVSNFFKEIIDFLAISLKEFNTLVNSKSWGEFWSRIAGGNQGNLIFDTNKSVADLTKRINDNQKFLYPTGGNQEKLEEKLFGIGKDGFNRYLDAVKKTTSESKETLLKFRKDVTDGTITDKGGFGGIEDFSVSVEKSKTYYKDLLELQKKFGFDKKSEKIKQTNDSGIEDKAAKRAADAEQKRLEAAEKKARDSANKMLDLAAKTGVAQLELQYAQGSQETADQIKFEDDKYKILTDSYNAREKLYAKDSEEYKKLELDKIEATKDYTVKIAKINKDADDKALKEREKAEKDKEKLDKSISGAGNAQRGLDSATKIGDLGVGRAKGDISDSDFNKQLFAIRKADIQEEIDAAQAQMDKFTEIDSEYFDAKKDRINAEKDLVREQSDYEISEAERVAELKKQTEQAVFDFVSELSGSLFSIGSMLGEQKIADLEHQRDAELSLAGTNADAKVKIQANFDKKILAQKRKQAAYDKIEALFNIGINTAVAVMKVTAQAGILSPFLIPGIIAAGALQAATVLAKPLPKYRLGRKGGKAEAATVNDGGPEIIEGKDGFRVAGGGKETVTWLNDGDIVHPHEKSVKMIHDDFEISNSSNKFIDNLIFGQGIMRAKEENNQKAMVNAIVGSKLSKSDMTEAFGKSIDKLEIQQLIIDENGHNTYLKRKNQRINDQNSRNTFGGKG